MSQTNDGGHDSHEGPIKTPRQLIWVVTLSFIVPVLVIIALVNFVASGAKPAAGTTALQAEAVDARIAPLARVVLKDASDVASLKTGEQVYQAQCSACHNSGAAGAPKLGDAAAWPVQGLIRHFRHEIEKRIDQYAANPHSERVRVAAE